MRGLASFASSEAGKAFARIEQNFGRDPAAALEPVDDVLAHNLRAAFVVSMAEREPEEDEHASALDRARQAGQEIRKQLG